MELRREILLSVGALLGFQLLFAFGAIGLFLRVEPAVDEILFENVASMAAGEEILGELAARGDFPLSDEGAARLRDALRRAQGNVTEEAEAPVLLRMKADLDGAILGGGDARGRVLSGARELITINREAMSRVDRKARRLGSAGAWSAVLLGSLSFFLGLLIAVRLKRRIIDPVEELHAVLASATQGGALRRCQKREVPLELKRVAEQANRLLDERRRERSPSEAERHELGSWALLELLERSGEALALVDDAGNVVRASAKALELLASEGGAALRDRLREAPPELLVSEAPDGRLRLVELARG